MSNKHNWPFCSYDFFRYGCNYLYLGAKQDRAPWEDFYGNMYSHLRSGYTIFFYKIMWLNYIKKINLVTNVLGDTSNQVFFLTNRIEHLKFLDAHADKLGINTLFYEKSAQFSYKCGIGDINYMVGNKVRGLGVNNFISGPDYAAGGRAKVFITIANNDIRDRYFYKSLSRAELKFLTFTPADTNSHYVSHFIPLFGNNESAKAWHFYLSVFYKCSPWKKIFHLSSSSTRTWKRANIVGKKADWNTNFIQGLGNVKSSKTFSSMLELWPIRRVSRGARSLGVNRFKIKHHYDYSFKFEPTSGIFLYRKDKRAIKL